MNLSCSILFLITKELYVFIYPEVFFEVDNYISGQNESLLTLCVIGFNNEEICFDIYKVLKLN